MTARAVPFFKTKLQEVSRELYREHGWQMPRGLANKSERDPLNFTLAEWQQAKRSGQDPRTVKASIQDAWAISDSRASFENALNERGFWLAKGDRRSFVAVDYTGEVHSVPRAIGRKAREVRSRLGAETGLADVAQVKSDIAAKMTRKMRDHVEEAKGRFARNAEALAQARSEMVASQRAARKILASEQAERRQVEASERQKTLPQGLKGIWSRVTGQYGKLKANAEEDAKRCASRDNAARDAMIRHQRSERRILQKAIRMQRGTQAELLRDLRRDIHRYIALGRDGPEPLWPSRSRSQRRLER